MNPIQRNITKSFLIVLSSIIFSSCSGEEIPDGKEINFESIAQHFLSTAEELSEQQLVIRDQESWEDFISQMDSVNDQSKYFNRTEFDFSGETLLVVIDKFRPNGGHSIKITKLLEANNQINAFVEKPQNGNATTMVMQPYHIISIEKTNKSVGFILKY